MNNIVALALIIVVGTVVMTIVVINFLNKVIKRFSAWRHGPFTPEENAAYYRGLHRGHMESGYYQPRLPRYSGGRHVRLTRRLDSNGAPLDTQQEIEWDEPADDPRCIDAPRSPAPHPHSRKLLR